MDVLDPIFHGSSRQSRNFKFELHSQAAKPGCHTVSDGIFEYSSVK